jgi:hypothetical protein
LDKIAAQDTRASLEEAKESYSGLAFVLSSSLSAPSSASYAADSSLQERVQSTQQQLMLVSWLERTRFVLSLLATTTTTATTATAAATATATAATAVTYRTLGSLVAEATALISTNQLPKDAPIHLLLTSTWTTATTTHDRLEALLNSTTDEEKVESVYKEISNSTVRYTTLLHRVNGALDIQRWILGAKIILNGTQRTRNYLKQQIMTCPVTSSSSSSSAAAATASSTSATHTYVKCVCIVHVGGTRCVTSSTDNMMNIQCSDHFDC